MATSRAHARAAVDRSFEQLYRGHHADVFRAALRELGNVHDAEDVTQAAFVDAYRAVLRGSRPQAPRAWLLAIAENVRRRRYRTSQRRPREELMDAEPMDADFPLSAEIPHELAHALAAALAELPDEQRRVFVLRELGGLSYDEIAEETGSTVGAIQMLLFRARRTLRDLLEPPVVARRRTGLVIPLPGWLTALASRAEVATTLTPRAAGALGATVMAVVGVTVTAGESPAGSDLRPVVEPAPAVVEPARPVARVVSAAVAPAVAPPLAAPVRSKPTPRRATPPSRPSRPVAAVPKTVSPTAGAPPARPSAAGTTQPPSVPALVAKVTPTLLAKVTLETVVERPRLPVRLPDEKVEGLLESPVPPLSTAPVLEAVIGAAGAAGAGAPPLPIPGVPPVDLPPVP
jgi:RNA polymerase sigma-70 factor (ECF subfamily)